jgi:hypothetical protein
VDYAAAFTFGLRRNKEPEMVSIQTSVSKGWLHEESGFRFDERYYFDPLYRWEQDRTIDRFLADRFPDHPFHNMESNLVQGTYFSPDQVLVGGIQPNLIVGACLGAGFVFPPDKDSDIAGRPLAGLHDLADLPAPAALLEHPLIRRLDAQIAAVRQARPDLRVVPPFFWDTSGRATIHGFITTSLKLYGEEVFVRVVDDPDFVGALHDWITTVYIALIRHYSRLGDLPVTSVHIGECSGTMLRPAHYQRFIIPYASRLGRELGPVRLHSCGRSDHLLAAIAQIENLGSLDTGSNTSVAAIRARFGADFRIDLAPPVELLLEGADRAGVVVWLEHTLAENGGGPLHIGFHLEPGYSVANCQSIHDELRLRGV